MNVRSVFVAALLALAAIQGGASAFPDPPVEHVRVTGGLVELDKAIQTDVDLVFRVTRWVNGRLEVYDVLFGPDKITPNAPALAKGKFRQVGTQVDFQMEEGYLYMAGTKPYGGTGVGTATSDGTIIVVRRNFDRGGGVRVDRFFLLGNRMKAGTGQSRMTVHTSSTSNQTNAGAIDEYFDVVISSGALEGPTTIPTNSVTFINFVVERAREAGLEAPAGWPQ
jgi:hypothetical protein